MPEPEIGILKMPMGNLRSAFNAVYETGFDPRIVDEHDTFDHLSHLIVPGVGHFAAVMAYLRNAGLAERIRAFAASGRPLLGICVGMQLLAESGTEGGDTLGLALVPGTVRRLAVPLGGRLPHVGWNTVEVRREHPVTVGIKPNRDFYFVHSYALDLVGDPHLIGEATYGAPFTAIVAKANVVGFQFHPEKSQANGLRLIENFCNWSGAC